MFCTKFEDLYDSEIEPIFNTHSIYHLVQDAVQRNENPEDINCFMFENYLGQIKKMIRTPNKPLSQVCKRLAEVKDNVTIIKDSYSQEFSLIYEKCGLIIKAIKYKDMHISKLRKDSFILLSNGNIMSVKQIIKDQNSEIQFRGSVYQCTENLFNFSTISSSALYMYRVRNLSQFQFSATLNDLVTKCIVGLLHINY